MNGRRDSLESVLHWSKILECSFLGAGACLLDYDGDGKIDLFLQQAAHKGGMGLYHNLGDGKFEDVTQEGRA